MAPIDNYSASKCILRVPLPASHRVLDPVIVSRIRRSRCYESDHRSERKCCLQDGTEWQWESVLLLRGYDVWCGMLSDWCVEEVSYMQVGSLSERWISSAFETQPKLSRQPWPIFLSLHDYSPLSVTEFGICKAAGVPLESIQRLFQRCGWATADCRQWFNSNHHLHATPTEASLTGCHHQLLWRVPFRFSPSCLNVSWLFIDLQRHLYHFRTWSSCPKCWDSILGFTNVA